MKLYKARISTYRSIRDTDMFDVECEKTIFVGPNEAGKTVILQALQQLNPPTDIQGFESLRDYPRSDYNEDIGRKTVKPSNVTVVEGHFKLDQEEIDSLPDDYKKIRYICKRMLDNTFRHYIDNGPDLQTYASIYKDLNRLTSHVDRNNTDDELRASQELKKITGDWEDETVIDDKKGEALRIWLEKILHNIDESNKKEEERYNRLISTCKLPQDQKKILEYLKSRVPLFVLFNNYYRVRPRIHLEHLANREKNEDIKLEQFDYGNLCLLKLLGFTARELADLGNAPKPSEGDVSALKIYQDKLDERDYKLNAASIQLTKEIISAWNPSPKRAEANKLKIKADGQYLKVVVEDELGVEIELDQRSQGFQWLVSFFVVFFAEAADKHKNAILLLDEPGLHLHGLKQREFRKTISRLAANNQTLYTTHSPFLVGPDELDIVRVVDMTDRTVGTKVHGTLSSADPAALLPLQEALGYDLAQSLFSQTRNLILEGLTDFWYLESVAHLLRAENIVCLNEKIALIFANTASKVVYYATILHAHELKVAALLDSDAAGDQAANQDTLIHTLGNKKILRTRDFYSGDVTKPEIEDLLRETLIKVANSELGWDIKTTAANQPRRPIVEIFAAEISEFSKYKLAKAFIRWVRIHDAYALSNDERDQWSKLINAINNILK